MESRLFPCESDDYAIELLDKKKRRKDEIVDMLIENFLHDETLVRSLRVNADLTESEEQDLTMDERLMMSNVVEEGTAVLLATHKETNRIAGAVVIIIHDREEEIKNDGNKKSKPYEGRLRSKVMKDFYKYIEEIEAHNGNSLSSEYPNCKIIADIEMIGVNKLDRRKGIAFDLYKAALTVIKDIPNVTLVTGTYTSVYSQKIAQKIGKSIISKFDVTQIKDDCGHPVFQDTVPHNFVTLMAMEI